ncbi:glycosyltransferase [Dryocola clanedunensis]|uniref:glycosyltransferase n=1 Tax=Cedecea sulfonylureivorans TaxID=3051154 RepID=UPI0019271BDF|nr:glycosyltransferase [Cedecea sulfonylureivorans]
MKIVIPVIGFGKAGGYRVLSKLANELIKHGHDVYFVAPDKDTCPYYETTAKIVRSKRIQSRCKILNSLFNFFYLWRECKRLKANVVIANYHLTAYLVALLPAGVSKYYYIQAYEVVFFNKWRRQVIAYLTYLLPLKKIVNHEGLLPKKVNNYVAIVPPGIEPEIFYLKRKSNRMERITIGVVGRKEKHKGTNEIIDTILNWNKKDEVILHIAIFLDDNQRKLIDDHNIPYEFFSVNNDVELADFYRSNDLIIAVGLVEDGAFHYPCAEAMSCGSLVISNYAPLSYTNSRLRIETYSSNTLLEKLDCFYNMSIHDTENEIERNKKIVDENSWDKVGNLLDVILTK